MAIALFRRAWSLFFVANALALCFTANFTSAFSWSNFLIQLNYLSSKVSFLVFQRPIFKEQVCFTDLEIEVLLLEGFGLGVLVSK